MGTISDFIKHLPCKTAVFMITFYRAAISPLFPSCCRFTPTCSEYGIIAFRRYGFWKGLKLTVKRILRCRPGRPSRIRPRPLIGRIVRLLWYIGRKKLHVGRI